MDETTESDEQHAIGDRDTPIAVVTGGSRGIGRACVARLAAQGHLVVATGRHADALDATAAAVGYNVVPVVCDVTDEEAITDLFDRLPRVDVLVNNAGVSSSAPAHRTTLDDWEYQLRVNATGAFLTTRSALQAMRAAGHGRIVMIASTSGLIGEPYTAAYTASKHALIGLTRAVAAEVAGSSITCNAVCPDWVRTDMLEESVRRIVERTGRTADEALAEIVATTRLGRLIEPEEVADAVIYLCGDGAAAVNGQALTLDGGRSVT